MSTLPLLGFVAWSGTGKTTLLERLIPLLGQRGLRLGVLKHTHHHFDMDKPGKDSHRLRQAGARQVMAASSLRHALICETPEQEPSLEVLLARFDWERLDRLVNLETYSRLPGVEALEEEMNRANVVEPTEVPPEVVTMNSTVEFIDDKTGQTFQMTLVYPDAVTGHETVSIFAPVGSALLGLSVGQSIVWQIPGGRELNLRVLKVLRQPEAMGEFHR